MGIYDHEEYSGFTWKDQGISVFAIDGLIRRLMGEIVEAEDWWRSICAFVEKFDHIKVV